MPLINQLINQIGPNTINFNIYNENKYFNKINKKVNNRIKLNTDFNKCISLKNLSLEFNTLVKLFINDMFNFNIDSEDVSYESADNLFDLMCTPNYIKNDKLFDIFFHDNYYVRDNIKKIIR